MHSHRDRPCKFSSCTIYHKRHNTLLHLERPVALVNENTTVADSEVARAL